MSDYAPEYTKKERIHLVLKYLAFCIPIYAVCELWFFDWMAEYSSRSNCYVYGDVTGSHLVMYGTFVGIPLLLAISLFIFEGRRSIKVLRLGQSPLPGEKVFTKTKYKFGLSAKVQPFCMLGVIVMFLILSVWGAKQAHELTQNIKPCQKIINH